MDRPKFVIEAAEAQSTAENSGLKSVVHLLHSLVKQAQYLARPPISNYHVGAVGLGSSGRIFFGVNIEFPGLPLHHSIHAEQFLLTNLSLNGETRLDYFAVSAAPCGHCRQFIQETRNAPEIRILITDHAFRDELDLEFDRFGSLLPHRFGPDDLLEKDVPLLLEPHHNRLSFTDSAAHLRGDGVVCNGSGAGRDLNPDSKSGLRWKELRRAALEAANGSHAPYSGCPSGVAMMDSEGKVYRGSYMESAAYNPSLGPVQAAVVDYVANGGGGGYEMMVAAVLVEKEDAVVKQEHTARLFLQVVSPKCEFQVFHCVSGLK